MEQRLVEDAPITSAHCNVYSEARSKNQAVISADCTNFTTMFSSVQVKQEYGGSEDNAQNNSTAQGTSEYPAFSNQDVEYMYRQLPYFWNQTQLQTMQLPDDLPSENEAPVRQDISHLGQPQFTPASYLQQNMTFPMNQLQQNQNQQLLLGNMSPERGRLPQVSAQPSMVTVHNSPGRPPKPANPGKSLKCRCEICFKEFGHKSNLFIHMRTHNGERPYKCSQCDKRFTHSGNLAIHLRTHSGERPYSCQICGKLFSHSGNLSTHLRTHSGVKPYKCSQCGKEFRHSGNLSIHERIHSGIKPFKCSVCGKDFYHSGNLTTHIKRHPVTVVTECSEAVSNASTISYDSNVQEMTRNDQTGFPVKVEHKELSAQDNGVLLSSTTVS